MCRIGGIFTKHANNNNISDWAKLMADAMHRGGPDDSGLYLSKDEKVAFSHRRLSILDLSSAGHQPMYSADKQIVISFNGEIYNFKAIKSKLETFGYDFKTNTDTEVIIAAYQTWGENAFSNFQGMFAFLLHDNIKNEIYIVRDSLGIKPLYIYEDNSQFIFSSEIRAIEALPIRLTENPNWEMYFLAFGFIPEPFTVYENIKMLPKSHFLKINTQNGHSETVKYTPNIEKYIFELDNISEELNKKLSDSVKSHLVSDAPIGVFLSGGIDSSLISIIASKYQEKELKTLSLNFDIEAYNESDYQQIIVDKIKSNHVNEIITFSDFETTIPDYLYALDQPTSDAINTYFVSLAAKKSGLKAVLSGLGADEIFGGYPSFFRANFLSFLHKNIPRFLLKTFGKLSNSKYKKFEYLSISDDLGIYLCNRGIFSPTEISNFLGIDLSMFYKKLEPLAINSETKNKDNFDKTAWYETNIYMQNQLLRDSDVMSMWHGIELRVPFVDQNMMDFVNQIPSKYKNTKLQKKLLIDSFSVDLPQKIWDREKKGFTLPFQVWIGKSNEIINTLNQNPAYFTILNEFKIGKVHWSRIWILYILTIWKQKIKLRTLLY